MNKTKRIFSFKKKNTVPNTENKLYIGDYPLNPTRTGLFESYIGDYPLNPIRTGLFESMLSLGGCFLPALVKSDQDNLSQ